jgi:predicted metalloendopeptidase
MSRIPFVWVCVAVLMAGCAVGTGIDGTGVADRQTRLAPEEIAETVLASMDRSADPCEDFYRYACGGWLDSNEIPSDQARWTRSFSVVREGNREVVRKILEEAAQDPGSDPDRKRIGLFYAACLDEEAVERAGVEPLQPIFDRIAEVEDAASLMSATGQLHRWFVGALFEVQPVPDFANPDLNIAFFSQGGLGMPDRDYYVSEDEKKQELLAEYEKHVARIFALLGEDRATAEAHAAEVLAFETELARNSRDRAGMRQLEQLYNKMDVAGLKQLTPGLPWDNYLEATGHPEIVQASVATPEFFEALEGLVQSTPPERLRTYLRWHAVHAMAGQLPQRFVDESFEFYGKKIAGQEEIKPRWKRCVDATENALGESVGKLYVEQMFAGDSKEIALEMIQDIKQAFGDSLPALSWMDPVTRERAREKLAAMGFKIGYPDAWRDYSSVELVEDDYFGNTLSAIEFEFDRLADQIDEPVDREEWLMTPQMVNAYNHPLLNEMAYPAGILQPPFFHRDFPAAMNYGAIGGGMGHELTHGFDDQGRKFNPHGRMEEWWEPEVADKFEQQAQCVDDFYSAYEVAPGAPVNGKLTLGENIADIGGVKASYNAYKLWEQRHGVPDPAVEELTNEQLLFVAWGQVWCTLQTEEAQRLQVTTDPHSPAQFRVMGPMAQVPEFARAFDCEVGEPMRPEEQCVVW